VGEREDPRAALEAAVRRSLGFRIEVARKVFTVKHGVTHHRITLSCYEARHVAGRARPHGYAECRWELPARLGDYPLSSPQRRLIAAIQDPRRLTPELF
jgi:A/G-specific adenine glycosylase